MHDFSYKTDINWIIVLPQIAKIKLRENTQAKPYPDEQSEDLRAVEHVAGLSGLCFAWVFSSFQSLKRPCLCLLEFPLIFKTVKLVC